MTRVLRGDRAPEDAGPADEAVRSGPGDTSAGTREHGAGESGPGTRGEDRDAEGTGAWAGRDDPGTPADVSRASRDDSGADRPRPQAGADESAGEAAAPRVGPDDPDADGPRPAADADEAEETEKADEAEETEKADEADEAEETETAEEAEEPAGRRPGRLRVIALAALTVVLVLAGCGLLYRAQELRSAPAAENRALTDSEATTRVADDIADDLARVFSYTPDGLDATERSARTVLTGRAARQYTQLLARIRADVAKQRVTLSTQAVRTGVIRLDGDDARLLVFLDQVSRRGKAAGTSAAAQLTVTAHRENGQWRIVDIISR
ncbi:hypothetical protein [Streptomyces sp. GMY02]|uniref:hypothetical protein n=1 Tax=Streptomyces sp. GMY02 TaxID=1333528 RepID=UPI002D7ED229|nr:hypothetical protein [Streptomyces sp. GMY02]